MPRQQAMTNTTVVMNTNEMTLKQRKCVMQYSSLGYFVSNVITQYSECIK